MSTINEPLLGPNVVEPIISYPTYSAIPVNLSGMCRVGTDLYIGNGSGLIKVMSNTTVNVLPSNTGAVNSALIQAALDIGGDVRLVGNGVCFIDTTLYIGTNTNLYVSDLLTLKAGKNTTGSLLKNNAQRTISKVVTLNYDVLDPKYIRVTWNAHGLEVANFVQLFGATRSIFRGVFSISSVVNANVFKVALERLDSTLITETAAGTTRGLVADNNFYVTGGKWNYNYQAGAFNQGYTTGPNDAAISIAGAANFAVRDISGQDTKRAMLLLQAVKSYEVSNIVGQLTSDCCKIYGPSYDGKISSLNAEIAGGDVLSLQVTEAPAYQYIMPYPEGGDIFNTIAESIGGITPSRGFALFGCQPTTTSGIIDIVKVTNVVSNSSGAVVTIDGAVGVPVSSFGTVTFDNISGNWNSNPLLMLSSFSGDGITGGTIDIKALIINNPVMNGKANIGKLIQVSGVGHTNRITAVINGGYFEYGDNVLNLGDSQSLAIYNFKGLHVNSGWALFSLNSNCKIKLSDAIIEGTIGKFVVGCTSASTVSEVTIENTAITAAIINSFVTLSTGANLKLTLKNVNFTTVPVSFIANTTANASTVDIYAENVTWNGAINITNNGGTTTINSWGEGLVIDVINLSLAKGQKAWHSSAIAGRDAAAQQGPAFCNGTNWYALGTGASGVNTLIR
jgi:hypothetical protein